MKIFGAGKKLFRRRGAKPLSPARNKRISGNIFFALFAAVGMVGAVGYGFNTVIKGPIRGMTEVTKRTVAESTVVTSSKLAIVGATTQQTLGGDCDADGSIEPIPYRDPGAGIRPVGGGYLPTGMLPSTLDPWNTEYGYCAWDAGSLSVSNAVVACGGATPRRLQGSPGGTQASIAIISAGRDKVFQTSCIAYNGATPNNPLVVKVAGSDDVVLSYTYAEANDLGNGLWKPSIEPLKTATTTTSDKGLEVGGGGTFTDKVVMTGGGLVLPDQTSTGACDSLANDKQIRRNTISVPPSIEICDFMGGLGWVPVSGVSGTSGASTGQLVGHWQLNETTGTIAKDRLARADGTLVDGPIWESTGGKIGGSLLFDASVATQSVSIPKMDAHEPTAITIAAWVKPDTTQPQATTRVLAKQYSGSSNSYSISINSTPRWLLGIRYSGGTHTLTSPSGSYRPNIWQHVVGVYDPNGPAPQLRLYVNGTLLNSQNGTQPIEYEGSVGGGLFFGNSGSGTTGYKGSLDDVRIYNYGMTDLQVEELYQLSQPEINVQTVKKPGNLMSWGNDDTEKLGNGTGEGHRDIPGPVVNGAGFVDIATRAQFGCGLKADGTVWCWGNDSNGKLGNGSTLTSDQPIMTKVDTLNDAVQISAGNGYACAVRRGGEVWCWGLNADGQHGNGTTTQQASPVKGPTISDFIYVSAGNQATCGVRQNGEAWCWGLGTGGALGNGTALSSLVPVKVSGVDDFVHISMYGGAAAEGVCGVTKRGIAYCWGQETSGNFGNGGTSSQQNTPVPVSSITDFVKVELNDNYACGLRGSGSIWCWGAGSQGRLGNGTNTTSDIPVEVLNINDFVDMHVGRSSACGIRKNREAWCWGNDASGELGNGPVLTANQWIPTKVIGGDFLKISVGNAQFMIGIVDPTPNKTVPLAAYNRLASSTEGGCLIRPDETLWCWGGDAFGELGNAGATGNSPTPVRVSDGGSPLGWTFITGNNHKCGIKTDGTAWCWGSGADGKLGNGGTANSNVPSPVTVSDTIPWVSLITTQAHSCGIKADGTGWCWGSDSSGQLGNGGAGSSNVPVAIDGTAKWNSLEAGSISTCGIKSDGTLWCWGADTDGILGNGPSVTSVQQSPYQVGTQTDWISVDVGANSACALKSDGTAWCWGNNASKRLGIYPTLASVDQPNLVLDPGPWQKTTFGANSNCGIKMDGSAWCWGIDANGRLGNGPTITATQDLPYPVLGSGAWKILQGANFGYCGVKSDDSVWCWGEDTNGALGNGAATTAHQHSPYPVSLIPAKAQFVDGETEAGSLAQGNMAAGASGIAESAAAARSLTFAGSGRSVLRDTSAPAHLLIDATESGSSAQMALGLSAYNYTFGYNSLTGTFGFATGTGWIEDLYPAIEVSNVGDVGIGTIGAPSVKLDVAGGIKLPADASCTGSKPGTLAYNSSKIQYCDGTWQDLKRKDTTPLPWDLGKASITMGLHGCAIKSDGTAWCWGNGANGKLGNGGTGNSSVPVPVSDAGPWTKIEASRSHTCAIKHNGTAWCWGNGANGRLGDGGTANSLVPVQVVATGTWIDIEAAQDFTCGIKSDGTAWCWGVGTSGRLGNGLGTDSSTPVQVSGAGPWVDISSASSHSCGIKADGTAWCWGNGSNGKLGNSAGSNQLSPVAVTPAGTTTWISISAAASHTCGVKSDGTAWCWGIGASGNLGNGGWVGSNIPVAVSGAGPWLSMANTGDGADAMCGIKSGGSVWCWGEGGGGRLGNGLSVNQGTPVQIDVSGPWISVAGGESFFCATREGGSAWCWGTNTHGQLGDGGTTSSSVPVQVAY